MVKPSAGLAYLTCPTCQGEGVVSDQTGRFRTCPTCQAVGVLGFADGLLFAYREVFSNAALHLERLHALVRALVDGVALFIGVSGFFVLAREYLLVQPAPDALLDFVLRQSPGLAYFWLTAFVDLYVFYRFTIETEHPRRLRVPTERAVESPADFSAALKRPTVELTSALSLPAHTALVRTWSLASQLKSRLADDRHLLAALLGEQSVRVVCVRFGLAPAALQQRVAHLLEQGTTNQPPVVGAVLKRAVIAAAAEAAGRKAPAVEPLDLLIGTAAAEGVVRELFDDLGLELAILRHIVAWVRISTELRRRWRSFRAAAGLKPKGVMDRAMTAQASPVLERFSHDLTALARDGALPLTVARETEVAAVFRALESQANAVLVGHPGVGKTAIVDALANRMAAEDVPSVLQDKRLIALSVPTLVAGAGAVGQLEERLTAVLDEIVRAGNIVLVIENIQNLIGVSSTGGQSLDLSGILAQALQSRRFFVVATTTTQDYERYIERSGQLVSAFDRVDVPELDHEGTTLVLMAKAGSIEAKHKVMLTYGALAKAAEFADRYLHDRFQPRKSIDLLEEVAAAAHRLRGASAVVGPDDVAAVVSEKTHVEVRQVTETEKDKLMHLEDRLHARIVGQHEAVKAVSAALRRARAELRDPKRPIATFLFLGPTGVGKTELAKTVAATYFGNEGAMLRLDMSEYQEPASLYRLIGAPPGFGATEGALTEGIRRNPFTLVLLDELEKAHPDVLNVFLQVMDDGRLTDSAGRTADFTNAIIIATSNAGTQVIQDRIRQGATIEQIKTELINEHLRQYYRPEFLNRFDGIIVFKPLTEPEIEQIAGLLLHQVAEQLAAKGIALQATPEAVRELGQVGFDPVFGARPLRRAIQERVDDALANFLLTGQLGRRDVAVLEPGGVIRVEKASQV